ncbi:hypothetical protein GCM10020254_60460 [Streptomyces goshikiensis]
MAAEAEGAVDDDGPRLLQRRGQQVQAPLEHHRDMSGLASQSALSDNGAAGVRRAAHAEFYQDYQGPEGPWGRAPAGSRHFSATVAAVNEPHPRAVRCSPGEPANAANHPIRCIRLTPVG